MLATPLVLAINMSAYLATEAWLPAILWALHGLLSEGRVRWIPALAALLALAFLGGHAQGFLYEAQLAAAYAIFALFAVSRRGARRHALARLALAGLLALGLVSPQLLPSLELAKSAVRGLQGLPLARAAYGALSLPDLARGTLGPALLPGLGDLLSPRSPAFVWPALALPLLPFGLAARGLRAHWAFFAIAALLAGLYAVGLASPVFRIYHALPAGDLFRIPTRVAFVYAFGVAVLLALGLEGLCRALERVGRARLALFAAAIALVLAALDGVARTRTNASKLSVFRNAAPAPEALTRSLRERGRLGRAWIATAGAALPLKTASAAGYFALPDYEPTMPLDYQRYFFRREPRSAWHGHLAGAPRATDAQRGAVELARLLDLMSVRYVVGKGPRRPGTPGAIEQDLSEPMRLAGGYWIAERPSAVPRAYVVRCARRDADFESALHQLLEPGFDPRRQALLGAVPPRGPGPLARDTSRCPPGDDPDRDGAAIVAHANDSVSIEARCAATCLLVLTDLHYPGWQVYVDGEQRPLERVNALFRGVHLEAGAHRVAFRYEPASLRLGFGLAATSIAGGAALIAVDRWRRRRHADPAQPLAPRAATRGGLGTQRSP